MYSRHQLFFLHTVLMVRMWYAKKYVLTNRITTVLSFIISPYLRRTYFVEFATQMKLCSFSLPLAM